MVDERDERIENGQKLATFIGILWEAVAEFMDAKANATCRTKTLLVRTFENLSVLFIIMTFYQETFFLALKTIFFTRMCLYVAILVEKYDRIIK